MDWLIIIVVGALIGWLASLIMKTQMGIIVDILVGIIGSILGKWIFADLLGVGGAVVAGTFSIMGIFWGVVGAIILLSILKAIGAFSR